MVLVINELGDHQMETYFDISSEVGGMFCQEEYNEWDKLFDKIKVTNRQSVQEVGGEYIPQKNESIGAIRVAQNAFFKLCDTIENIFCLTLIIVVLSQSPETQGAPPQHHRFNNTEIPRHVTYAYKTNVPIIENDEFYTIPEEGSKTIDLLFVMANAPVKTASLPSDGVQSCVGI